MNRAKIVGWVILILAVPFWATAIASATGHGFFEDNFAVQFMILGGAVAMIGGAFLWAYD
jgi:hypothetical protein